MKKPSAKFVAFFVIIAIFAVQMPVAFAQQCLTDVSTSTSTSRATTGTSVTITATTTGSSCTISTLSLVSSPSLTVNDPASGQYSGFSAGTAKSFTVTAGTAGTYTYYARGTTSSGSVDSTQQILEFISPSDLTVSVTPASASVVEKQTFSLTINVQNTQSSAITTSYSVNLPSGLTRNAGDPLTSSGTSVSASSTKTLSITVAHTTCFTGTKTITFDLGGSTSVASVSVTGNSTCDTAAAAGGGGGGGGGAGGGAGVATEAHTFAQITPGAKVAKSFSLSAVKEISIEVNNPANNVRVTVTKLASQPATVTKTVSGNVFQYIEINASNTAGNIKNAAVTFDVTKSWLSSNGFEKSHVVLQRYTGSSWEKLPTTVVSEDANNVKYQATTSGFSVFAITAEKPSEAPTPAPTPVPTPAPTPEQPTAPGAPAQPVKLPGLPPLDATSFLVLVVAVVIVIGAVYYMLTKRKKPYKAQ